MQIITLQRQDTAENMLALAVILGYNPTVEVEDTKEMLVSEANEQGLSIKTVLEDTTKCIAIVSIDTVVNEKEPKAFVAEHYQAMIDNDIKTKVLEAKKQELAEKRAEEDKVIEEWVKAQVWESKIITE